MVKYSKTFITHVYCQFKNSKNLQIVDTLTVDDKTADIYLMHDKRIFYDWTTN